MNAASPAQVAANRANARRSTGPRTAAGKARSALNAMHHGVYSTEGATAIPSGPFAEDPDDLEDALESIAAALQPRDAVEWMQARRVAGLFNKLRRLDEFEANALGRDGNGYPRFAFLEETRRVTRSISSLLGDLKKAVSNELEGVDSDPCPNWEVLARFVVLNARPEGKPQWVKGLWTSDHVPKDVGEWRTVTLALLTDYFGDLAAAESWAREEDSAAWERWDAATTEQLEMAASRALNKTLATTVSLSGRLGSQLQQQLAVFHRLASRELGSDEVEHPDDDDQEEGED